MTRVENLRKNVINRPEIGLSLDANERPVEAAHNIKMINLRYRLNYFIALDYELIKELYLVIIL